MSAGSRRYGGIGWQCPLVLRIQTPKAASGPPSSTHVWGTLASPLFVAGLTLGVADATATAVAKIRIKQFLAIPLAGKVVAGPRMMTIPPCVLYRVNPVANQMPEA